MALQGSATSYNFSELAQSKGISDYRKVGLFCLWLYGHLGLLCGQSKLEKKETCEKVLLQELKEYKNFDSFTRNCILDLRNELNKKEAYRLVKEAEVCLNHIRRTC